MTTSQEIRNWIESRDPSSDHERMAAALVALMDLHRPQEAQMRVGDTRLCCSECHRYGQSPQWPCNTVQNIAIELGLT